MRSDRRGIAAVEFGLIAPVLVLVLLSVADLGNALQQSQRLTAAARAGALYAASFPTDAAGVQATVQGMLPGWQDVTVPSPAISCECPGSGAVDCAAACAAGLQRFISVSASRPFAALLWRGLSRLEAHVALRLQ